jgi:tetratricopeptide (TPR) repeat protein
MSNQRITVNGQPFFGRSEEQKQFRMALSEMLSIPPDEILPSVVLLYGDGGMGKTTLARRLYDIAQGEYHNQFQILWMDWEDERRRSARLQVGRDYIGAEDIFDALYALAVRQGWGTKFTQYQEALKAHVETEQKVAEAIESLGEESDRDELATLRGASATVIARLVRIAMPVVGTTGENLVKALADAGIKGGAEGLARLRAAATNRLKARLDPDRLALFLNPYQRLAAALAAGFQKVVERHPLILFLDTYEVVDRADVWLRMVMLEAGPRLLWVIAGRDNLLRSRQFGTEYFKGYAEDFPRRLLAYDMRQLARDDIRSYFAACVPERPLGDAELDVMSRSTRGIPLAVREAADIWKANQPLTEIVRDISDSAPGQQIVHRMTERYQLHCMNDETDSRALYTLALARGNVELLRAMLRPDDDVHWSLDAELRHLERDYASVHREHARLHDQPAAFFLEYLKSPLRRNELWVQQRVQRAIGTLQAQIDSMNSSLPFIEERCADEDWAKAALDLTDYLFWKDEEEAWRWLIPRFVEGLGYNGELWRGLLKVADDWEPWLSKGGKKRIKALRLASEPTDDDTPIILDEFARLERIGRLQGEGEAERKAILDLWRGRLYNRRREYGKALLAYEQAEQALSEAGEGLKKQLAAAVYNLALKLIPPGNVKETIQSSEPERIIRKVVTWLPEDPKAWDWCGIVLRRVGRFDDAIAAHQHAIALDPRWPNPHNGLGNIYRALDHYDEAIAAYQAAIALNPKFLLSIRQLGRLYRDLGRFEEAVTMYVQALSIDPRDTFIYKELSYAYNALGRYDDAIIACQQAIVLNPEYVWAHLSLAHLYRKLKRTSEYADQIPIVRRLIAQENEYGHACFESVCGNLHEALAMLQVALEKGQVPVAWARRDPDFDFIRDDPRFKVLIGE